MKMIDKIIADIPKLDIEKEDSKYKDELKYLADTRVILDNLRDYEVDIPKKYEDNVLGYMKELTNYKDFKGGNTYNYNGKILHDLIIIIVKLKMAFMLQLWYIDLEI